MPGSTSSPSTGKRSDGPRGGLTSKIHLAVDGRGLPMSVILTAGQAGEALLRWGGRRCPLTLEALFDGKGEFSEAHLEPAAGLGIGAEFVMSAAQVLDERVPATDSLGERMRFRPRIGRVRAFNRP